MVTLYRYSMGWKEKQITYKDDYVVGSKTRKLLDNREESLEILELLQTQAEETQADSMDIYFDESYARAILTIKLFDEDEDLIKMFNVSHSLKLQEFLLLLEFLQFNLEHDVNVYQYKGKIAESLTEDCKESYEMGRMIQTKIRPR